MVSVEQLRSQASNWMYYQAVDFANYVLSSYNTDNEVTTKEYDGYDPFLACSVYSDAQFARDYFELVCDKKLVHLTERFDKFTVFVFYGITGVAVCYVLYFLKSLVKSSGYSPPIKPAHLFAMEFENESNIVDMLTYDPLEEEERRRGMDILHSQSLLCRILYGHPNLKKEKPQECDYDVLIDYYQDDNNKLDYNLDEVTGEWVGNDVYEIERKDVERKLTFEPSSASSPDDAVFDSPVITEISPNSQSTPYKFEEEEAGNTLYFDPRSNSPFDNDQSSVLVEIPCEEYNHDIKRNTSKFTELYLLGKEINLESYLKFTYDFTDDVINDLEFNEQTSFAMDNLYDGSKLDLDQINKMRSMLMTDDSDLICLSFVEEYHAVCAAVENCTSIEERVGWFKFIVDLFTYSPETYEFDMDAYICFVNVIIKSVCSTNNSQVYCCGIICLYYLLSSVTAIQIFDNFYLMFAIENASDFELNLKLELLKLTIASDSEALTSDVAIFNYVASKVKPFLSSLSKCVNPDNSKLQDLRKVWDKISESYEIENVSPIKRLHSNKWNDGLQRKVSLRSRATNALNAASAVKVAKTN